MRFENTFTARFVNACDVPAKTPATPLEPVSMCTATKVVYVADVGTAIITGMLGFASMPLYREVMNDTGSFTGNGSRDVTSPT
jgi:hypothetical protein